MIDTIPPVTFSTRVEISAHDRVERIRQELRNAADSFINAGFDFRAAYRAQEWVHIGLDNFTQYCQQLDVTDSWAYDLIRIADLAESFPEYRPRMLDVGISKMRLLAPHLEQSDADQLDTLLDMANEKPYRELRRELHTSEADAPLPPAINYCPACGCKLHLSRMANLELAEYNRRSAR